MAWLGGLFGKKQSMDILPSGGLDAGEALTVSGTNASEARELINRAAYETLQLNGVPKDWVKLEILTLSDNAKAYFQLQVTLRHWDAYLLLHSWAFEQTLMGRVRERSLPVSRALRAVLWRVASDAGCPYDRMPPSVAWTPDAIKQREGNGDLLKAKVRLELPKNLPADGQGEFPATLQVDSSAEADAVLQQILAARQGRP
jgi:hypothetical protein